MGSEPEVELIGVTKRFGQTVAAESVCLQVARGEFLTLLGPSGCGKTTLLRIIAGFESPDEGRVMLGGRDVTKLPPYDRDVTTVFQHYALFPHMDVFKNVAFGLERRRLPRDQIKQRVGRALELVNMSGMERRRPSELSGGEQQRVALARSIVLEPRVLLLDEPLSALDLKLRQQMRVELKNLQRQLGISFVFVTHDQEEALAMSDRIAVMNAGRIEQVGTATDVYERPRTEFVAGFIGHSNIIEGRVESAPGPDGLHVRVGTTTIRVEHPDGKIALGVGDRIRLMIRPEKIILSDVSDALLCGLVESAVYMGESTRLRVRLDGGQEISVLEQNKGPAGSARDRTGQRVGLRWEHGSAVVLRD
jgi:spermidine/putrescine transport system ATP-binding protein